MDCNSIIYDSFHFIDALVRNGELEMPEDIERLIIDNTVIKIKEYIEIIKPSNTVFIAFDGVAPFAKMEQQRTRRHKTSFMSTIDYGKATNKKIWDTSSITPGTKFMEKLSKTVRDEFKHSEKSYRVDTIITSGSDECGEGEHKLYSHIRSNNFINDNVAIYGLDADLIMLSIFHLKYCKNVYVFRETPEFLKSSIPIVENPGNSKEPHFLDIKHLSSSIVSEMNCKHPDPHRINDYVFLCFLLGNDFLPHFPAMNIRTHGINAMLDIYKQYIGAYSDRFFISKTTGNIQWKHVGTFINEIAKREHQFLMNEYNVREKFSKRKVLDSTPEEKEEALLNSPIIYRSEEQYISPDQPYWEERYYKTLLGFEKHPDNIQPLCNNYLQGLEWVYKYYTNDCPDWRWKYNYHYPPLFSDLCKYLPQYETEFIHNNVKKSFSPYTQLAYVLPKKNLSLLPDKFSLFLTTNYSELYADEYSFQWAFCRYFWESHPILPEIPVELLEQFDIQFKLSTLN
jgi:5'-3' exonuclease